MGGKVRFGVVGIVLSLFLLCLSIYTMNNSEELKVNSMGNRLEQYMQDVYAPKTMQQFWEAKEDSKKYFEPSVTERFFVAYGSELTKEDLERECTTYIIHGKAENQSDKCERYLITAYIYNHKGAKPIIRDFEFILNNEGKVKDFIIHS